MAKYLTPKYYVICIKYRIKPTHLFICNDLMQKLSENKDLLENAIVSSKYLQKKMVLHLLLHLIVRVKLKY